MSKKLIKKLLRPVAGKKIFQGLFEKMHLFSVYGMNYGNGSYIDKSGERWVLKYIKARIKSDKVILFDVGANIGKYAAELEKIFGNSAVIYCFEPSLLTYRKLVENLAGFNNIHINNLGLGERKDSLKLYTDGAESGMASVYKRNLEHKNITMTLYEEVQIDTLDEYCLKHHIDHIDFLKLDVEGHELKVLEGGKKMLGENKVNFIQFEFGGCNIDSRTFFREFY